MKPLIALLNRSTVIADSAFPPVVAALQKQVSGDFAPLWGKDATLMFCPTGQSPPPEAWDIVVADTVSMAGALGYHDFTPQGEPVGKVGAKHKNWTVTASHEILEMLADPDIIRTAFIQVSPLRALIFAYEICDPVEADKFSYQIDGVSVSDFVTEAWFQPRRTGTKFTFRDTVKRPLTLAPGGYISVYRPGVTSRWTQITARRDEETDQREHSAIRIAMQQESEHSEETTVREYNKLPGVGSRRERRNRSHMEWIASETE